MDDINKCEEHSVEKNVYCLNCKSLQCPICLTGPSCKLDHKKVEVTEAAKELQEIHERDLSEITKLFTQIVHMEKKLEGTSQKLDELNKPKYSETFNALKDIQRRIENIYAAKGNLPNEVNGCQKLVSELKNSLVAQLTAANGKVQEIKKLVEDKQYLEILKTPQIQMLDPTEVYKCFLNLQTNAKQFFQSLETFNESFTFYEGMPIKYAEEYGRSIAPVEENLKESVEREIMENNSEKKSSATRMSELIDEKLKGIMDKEQEVWTKRLNELEEKLKKMQDAAEISEHKGSYEEISPIVIEKSHKPVKAEASGLKLHFASYLNLGDIKALFRNLPEEGSVYILGVKNGIQSTELAGLLYELEELRDNIEGVTLQYLYFSDCLPFKYMFQNIPGLKSLELLSCPFTTAQLETIVQRVVENGHQLEKLSVENALLGESPEGLIKAINKTDIKELKLANPKMKIAKFVETLKQLLTDRVELLDLGVFKADPKTVEMLKEWQERRKVFYVDDQTTMITRNTYKYQPQFIIMLHTEQRM
eukprot:TRINITY_DN31_c1_g1_i1.p1 TRINITY_DN31_c1_g1~~TRINITY_DN31_c1_g1_i1.p1  ORF type:complete len:534 (-),score=86.66 TRINITY_DN31_c1_g1_i1:385-1986(-)